MAQIYFHCSTAEGVDLAEARDHAALVVQSLIMAPSLEDWRGCVLHVSDDCGEEIFIVPFASVLGKPH